MYPNYERLEFLGDAVLNFAATAICFARFGDSNEGELSQQKIAIIQNSTLISISNVSWIEGDGRSMWFEIDITKGIDKMVSKFRNSI